jgi:hypothetical protein
VANRSEILEVMKTMHNIVIFLWVCIVSFSCDNRNSGKMYKEDFIVPSAEGIIESIELWKGGLLVIYLNKKDKMAQVTNDQEVLQEIKKEDFFKKLPNSNKCYIKRNDSIFYFDSINLKRLRKETLDSIGVVSQWERNKINRWIKLNGSGGSSN